MCESLCVVQCVTAMKKAVFHLSALTTVHVSVKPEPQGAAVTPACLDTPGEVMDRAAQVSCCYASLTTVVFLNENKCINIQSHCVLRKGV